MTSYIIGVAAGSASGGNSDGAEVAIIALTVGLGILAAMLVWWTTRN